MGEDTGIVMDMQWQWGDGVAQAHRVKVNVDAVGDVPCETHDKGGGHAPWCKIAQANHAALP